MVDFSEAAKLNLDKKKVFVSLDKEDMYKNLYDKMLKSKEILNKNKVKEIDNILEKEIFLEIAKANNRFKKILALVYRIILGIKNLLSI